MSAVKSTHALDIEMTPAENSALLEVADANNVSPETQAARLVLETLARRARGVKQGAGVVRNFIIKGT